jgi:hypothetical protein
MFFLFSGENDLHLKDVVRAMLASPNFQSVVDNIQAAGDVRLRSVVM